MGCCEKEGGSVWFVEMQVVGLVVVRQVLVWLERREIGEVVGGGRGRVCGGTSSTSRGIATNGQDWSLVRFSASNTMFIPKRKYCELSMP